jgi:hypothetical protein
MFSISYLQHIPVHRYDEAPLDQKPYRQKDGGLLAVGALNDKLKQTEPYKSQLENMLVTHVYPEFTSPAGHLRAKVCCYFVLLYPVSLLSSIKYVILFVYY